MLSESVIKLQPLPRIEFGIDCSQQIAKHVGATKSDRALIVTDEGLVDAGVVAPIAEALSSAGITVDQFAGVESNPTDKNVAEGVDALKALGDAAVVAVGGGSSMDCAKAIALLRYNDGHPRDFGYGCKPQSPGAPVIAIPTTAGTGSETNLVGVITDTENDLKIYVAHPSVQPRVALLDPKLTVGLPAYPTATCGFDVLTHALEAYTSRFSNPYADGVALQALKMAWPNLPKVCADGADIEARSHMLLASAMAAIAFNVAGLGAAHGTGHPIGAHYHTAHGQALATMLPHVMRFNFEARADKYAEVARALGIAEPSAPRDEVMRNKAAEALITAIEDLIDLIGLRKNLAELGGKSDDVKQLVEDALQDITMRTNPRKATPEDVAKLFEDALAG